MMEREARACASLQSVDKVIDQYTYLMAALLYIARLKDPAQTYFYLLSDWM